MKVVKKLTLELDEEDVAMLVELLGNHSQSSHEAVGISERTVVWACDVLFEALIGKVR